MTGASRHWSIVGATAVTPDGVLPLSTIVIDGGRIESVGYGPTRGDVLDLTGQLVLPGFIDVHVHGGGGASFNSRDTAEIDDAVAFHRAHGTTRTLASLVSESTDNTVAALHAIAKSQSRADGTLLGAHLEVPFLSRDRPGCHDLQHLLAPDPVALERLLSAEPRLVKTITFAPELAGADALIARLVDDDVRVGLGHSAADYETAEIAFGRGAHFVTHAHNAMDPVRHRAPWIIGAAAQQRKPLELISDGTHVHPSVVAMTFSAAPGRIILITDAAPRGRSPGWKPVTYRIRGSSHKGERTYNSPRQQRARGKRVDHGRSSSPHTDRRCPLAAAAHALATAPAELLGLQDETGH